MNLFLNDIRCAENPISGNRKIINTIAAFFLGIALGIFSKFWDFRQAQLPGVLMAIDGALDIHNFLGRFAIWALIALCISVYSNSAIRASVNVFVFFLGMVTSYYLYSNYVAGFFPRSYAMIWFGFTMISPFFGIYLLVCERKKQTGMDAVSIDFGSIVQHDFCIWMGIFRSTLYFGIGSLYDRSCCFKEGHTERFCANGKR